jgi:nuclear transcription factor Y gamma
MEKDLHGGYSSHMDMIPQFWANQVHSMQHDPIDFKQHALPLARVKKVMKTDDEINKKMMISGETPVLFSKACEMFILDLTMRAWIHTEESKRRTLQRTDISSAIQKCDIFDFLIDIVPREKFEKISNPYTGEPHDYQEYYQHLVQQYPPVNASVEKNNNSPKLQ